MKAPAGVDGSPSSHSYIAATLIYVAENLSLGARTRLER
jgi:hypothetical protein